MTNNRLKAVADYAVQVRRAERDRNRAIWFAFDPKHRDELGYTVDDIASAAGLSRPRIYQIVNEEAEDA